MASATLGLTCSLVHSDLFVENKPTIHIPLSHHLMADFPHFKLHLEDV